MSIESKISFVENYVFNKYRFKRIKQKDSVRRKLKYSRRGTQKLRSVYLSQDRRIKYMSRDTDDSDQQHSEILFIEKEPISLIHDLEYGQLPAWCYSDEQTSTHFSDLELLDYYRHAKCTRELWVSLMGNDEVTNAISICTDGEKLNDIASIPNNEMLDVLLYNPDIYNRVQIDSKCIDNIFNALDQIRMIVLSI